MVNVKEHNLVVKDVEDVFLRANSTIKIAAVANRLKRRHMVPSFTKYGNLDPYLFVDLMAIIRLNSKLQIISILTRYSIFCDIQIWSHSCCYVP